MIGDPPRTEGPDDQLTIGAGDLPTQTIRHVREFDVGGQRATFGRLARLPNARRSRGPILQASARVAALRPNSREIVDSCNDHATAPISPTPTPWA